MKLSVSGNTNVGALRGGNIIDWCTPLLEEYLSN